MKKVLLLLFCFSISSFGFGQDNIPMVYNFTGYTGAGLAPSPTASQLDSDSWSITGLSDGDSDFGDTNTGGDFSRDNTSGGVTTGGLYSLDNGAIFIQPGGSDFTPGELILKICNNSGVEMTNIDVDYDIKYLNDQGRANSFNFSWAKLSVGTYTSVAALDFTTPQASDGNGVQTVARNTTIAANLADGDCLLLRWTSNDVSGSGSRDEIGIDNIDVRENTSPTPVNLAHFSAKPMSAKTVSLDWSTATEENNEYFNIEHSINGRDFTAIDQVEGALNSTEMLHYNYMHKEASKGMNYYRLRQVDTDGTFSFSPIEVVTLDADIAIEARPTLAKSTVQFIINEGLEQETNVQIFDVLGRLLTTEILARGATQLEININSFQNGHYFIRLNNGLESQTTRFIKR